jgi:hypothetical protein
VLHLFLSCSSQGDDVFHTKVKQNVTRGSSRRRGSDKNTPVTTIFGVPFLWFSTVKIKLISLLL